MIVEYLTVHVCMLYHMLSIHHMIATYTDSKLDYCECCFRAYGHASISMHISSFLFSLSTTALFVVIFCMFCLSPCLLTNGTEFNTSGIERTVEETEAPKCCHRVNLFYILSWTATWTKTQHYCVQPLKLRANFCLWKHSSILISTSSWLLSLHIVNH